MSSVSTRFLAHSDENSDLIEHLLHVATKSKELYQYSKFENPDTVYYAGLLHDLGKINPWYQLIFHKIKSIENVSKEYERKHSVFSAWASYHLLHKLNTQRDRILVMIYGHHTELKHQLGDIKKGELFHKTQEAISPHLLKFSSNVKGREEFDELNWERCKERFNKEIQFDEKLTPNDCPKDFLDVSYAFSCLLQADRGSFSDWKMVPCFDLQLDTATQIKKSVLAESRTKFQELVLKEFNKSPILIINAPTGIGKTKAFLDIVEKSINKVERVFYFSPLLALTEDFERKLANTIKLESDQNDILIYNHLHSESLAEKNSEERTDKERYVFENESFNKKFVVTTTQRFLMTLFSNKQNDKMKLASLRNSLLIIDEVQTIPKPILANLKPIFDTMNKYMGTRFLLVSATIPHEIRDIPKIALPTEMQAKYLQQTQKQISFQDHLDLGNLPDGKILVMANTRRKAKTRFSEIQSADREVIYMSTGIRKKDRIKIIDELAKSDSNCILVATQVVEAGVDISFSKIFREEAPLDNIIQVMGRLNREGLDNNASLVIYRTDENHIPYSALEYQTTQEKIKGVESSVQIYDILEEYYKEISEENACNKKEADELKRYICRMDFERVWKFVNNKVFADDYRDTILIPDDYACWDDVKSSILDVMNNNRKKSKIFKKFGELTASLPVSIKKIGIEKFDEDLKKINILMLKKEYLEEIYDKDIGLDKWI